MCKPMLPKKAGKMIEQITKDLRPVRKSKRIKSKRFFLDSLLSCRHLDSSFFFSPRGQIPVLVITFAVKTVPLPFS